MEAVPQGLNQDSSTQPFADSEELRGLIALGRERGYLTFEQIAATLEEVEVTKEQVSALHSHLVEHGVEVLAEDGVSAYEEQRDAAANGRAKKPELDLTVEPSLDSLRLYLRSIGKVELLTAARRSNWRSGSSAATCSPSGRWSRPTCASSSRSRKAIWAAG